MLDAPDLATVDWLLFEATMRANADHLRTPGHNGFNKRLRPECGV